MFFKQTKINSKSKKKKNTQFVVVFFGLLSTKDYAVKYDFI